MFKPALAVAAVLIMSASAQAAVTYHTSLSSFLSASSGTSLYTFDDAPGGSASIYVRDGMVFDTTYGSSNDVAFCGFGTCGSHPGQSRRITSNYGAPMFIDLTGTAFPVTALGGEFGDYYAGDWPMSLRVYGLSGQIFSTVVTAGLVSLPESAFFGWTVSGDVITRIEWDGPGTESVDNLRIGLGEALPSQDVPLPGLAGLFGLALLMVARRAQ